MLSPSGRCSNETVTERKPALKGRNFEGSDNIVCLETFPAATFSEWTFPESNTGLHGLEVLMLR